jgi:hypothetical protein
MEQKPLKKVILSLKNQIVKLNDQLIDIYYQNIILIEFIKDLENPINPNSNQSGS